MLWSITIIWAQSLERDIIFSPNVTFKSTADVKHQFISWKLSSDVEVRQQHDIYTLQGRQHPVHQSTWAHVIWCVFVTLIQTASFLASVCVFPPETSRTASLWREKTWNMTLSGCSWPWRWWASSQPRGNSKMNVYSYKRFYRLSCSWRWHWAWRQLLQELVSNWADLVSQRRINEYSVDWKVGDRVF